jgi:hypothetical protein
MPAWLTSNWEHVLCALLLLGRVADVGTTWLATPRLELEANPLVRRLRWPFAVASLFVCFLAYFHTGLAYALFVASILVSASNARSIWLVRGIGEVRFLEILTEAAARSSVSRVLAWTLLEAGFPLLIGVLLWFLSGETDGWTRWAALGFWGYACVHFIHVARFRMRLVARGGRIRSASGSSER